MAYGQQLRSRMANTTAAEFKNKCPTVHVLNDSSMKKVQQLCPELSLAYSMKKLKKEGSVVQLFDTVCTALDRPPINLLTINKINAGNDINHIAFSPNDQFFSVHLQIKDEVHVWQTNPLEKLKFSGKDYVESNRSLGEVLWISNTEFLVSKRKGAVSKVSVVDRTEKEILTWTEETPQWFALSPDAKKLALRLARDFDSLPIRVKDIDIKNIDNKTRNNSKPEITIKPYPHAKNIHALLFQTGLFHRDGTLVLAGYNAGSATDYSNPPHKDSVYNTGKRREGLVELWNISQTPATLSGTIPLEMEAKKIALHPSQEILAVGSNYGYIELLNIKNRNSPKCFKQLKLHDRHVTGLAFTPNGNFLLSSSNNQQLAIWDIANTMEDFNNDVNTCNTITQTVLFFDCNQVGGGCNRIALSNDGKKLLNPVGAKGELELSIVLQR